MGIPVEDDYMNNNPKDFDWFPVVCIIGILTCVVLIYKLIEVSGGVM